MIPERTPIFLLANLGAEVKRLTDALHTGDRELVSGALTRSSNIFNSLNKMPLRPAERKEIGILREVIEDLSETRRRFSVTPESLESYFYPFVRKVLGV